MVQLIYPSVGYALLILVTIAPVSALIITVKVLLYE